MRRQPFRNPLFSRRRFKDNVIIRCVRWYLRFKLSYREMASFVGLSPICRVCITADAIQCGGFEIADEAISVASRRASGSLRITLALVLSRCGFLGCDAG